jgi:hypothetical protein
MSTVLETSEAVKKDLLKQSTHASANGSLTMRSLVRAVTLVGFVALFVVLTQLRGFPPALGIALIIAQIVLSLALFKAWSQRSS